MRTRDISHCFQRFATASTFLLLLSAFGLSPAGAQTGGGAPIQPQRERLPIILPPPGPAPATHENEMQCGGFIELAPPSNRLEVVGAEEEQEQRVFAEGDYLYISGGAQAGVRVGQEFSVVRPRGKFRSKWTRKSGSLGVYTQEVGRVRVVRVKDRVSMAQVVSSCDNLLLGDLLREAGEHKPPAIRPEVALDRFAEPTGKQTGRIVLARDGREMLSRDQVVFIDLGSEDNVKAGDYLTVYRPLGAGNLKPRKLSQEEASQGAIRHYESTRYRGGKFSNQSQRVRDPQGGTFSRTVTTPYVKGRRPKPMARKVVGEVVILSVEARTARAIITRVAQEIHTGDFVEMQ